MVLPLGRAYHARLAAIERITTPKWNHVTDHTLELESLGGVGR